MRKAPFENGAFVLGEFRDLRVAVWFLFELIPGSDTGNQEGISCPAGHDSGRCPENPQAFRERLERKLHYACGREFSSPLKLG